MGDIISKIPPSVPDLEEAVLGSILLQGSAMDFVADILKPEMFFRDSNQVIFEKMVEMYNGSQPLDLLTVTEKLRSSKSLTRAGGVHGVTALTNNVASTANIETHARIIAEKYVKRELIRALSATINECYSDSDDVFETIDNVGRVTDGLLNDTTIRRPITAHELYSKALDRWETGSEHSGITGVQSGFIDLDKVTGGFQDSDLIVLAGRPGMGKSSLALSIGTNAAIRFGNPGAMFNLEMSNDQLIDRQTSLWTGIPLKKIRNKLLAAHEFETINKHLTALSNQPIYFDDTAAITVTELRAKARRLKMSKGIRWIIVDYLQLMNTGNRDMRGNREQEVSFVSRSLKALAKELNIPVIALSQLSRDSEKRGGGRRPVLSDLRESGDIENNADLVMFVHRPEYYGEKQYEDGSSTEGEAEIIIAKHRNGEVTDLSLRFVSQTTGFFDKDHGDTPPEPIKPPTIPLGRNFYETEDETPF